MQYHCQHNPYHSYCTIIISISLTVHEFNEAMSRNHVKDISGEEVNNRIVFEEVNRDGIKKAGNKKKEKKQLKVSKVNIIITDFFYYSQWLYCF